MEINANNIDKIVSEAREKLRKANIVDPSKYWVVFVFCLKCGIEKKVGCKHYPQIS